ncbi:MAG: methionyl-tRNA formyltransferase, partial [Bacillota bacterium]|nr:methionyl-tRNA formyltransferase [Bacillota bacterium]
PEFAAGALTALAEAGHEITLVVTQPDKPKGRSKLFLPPPVKVEAEKLGIEVFQPDRIKRAENVEYLKNYEADVFVVAAFGQILSKEILEMPKYGCINIHASLLPKYRGAAPIQWSILNGEEKTGVTIMQMDEGLDTGDILLVGEIAIEDTDNSDTLHDKLMNEGAKLIVDALKLLEEGKLSARKQPDEPLFYASMIKKEDGEIDFKESAVSIGRKIRAFFPWPGTFSFLNGNLVKISEAKVINENTDNEAGVVTNVTKNSIFVQTGDGLLEILRIQPQGKKEMSVHDYLLGKKINIGDRFTKNE